MDKRLNEIDSVTSANDIVNVITLPSNADAKKATMTQLAEALIKTSEGKQIVAEAIGAYLTQAGLTTTFDGVVTTKNNKLSLINSGTLAQVVAGTPLAKGVLNPQETTAIPIKCKIGLYVLFSTYGAQAREFCIGENVGITELSTSINRWSNLDVDIDDNNRPTRIILKNTGPVGSAGRDYELFLIRGML